jgi:hypothetical protein
MCQMSQSLYYLHILDIYIYTHNLQLENDNMYSIYKASVSPGCAKQIMPYRTYSML